MASDTRFRSALAAIGSLPQFRDSAGTVLALNEIAHQGVIELARPRPGATLDAFLAAFHAAELPRIGASLSAGGAALLGIGPGHWLLIVSHDAPRQFPPPELAASFEVAVATGDAWTQLAITGTASRDLLAKGCALDLHPSAFREGACAAMRFAEARCVLHRTGADYRLLVGRSYAASLTEWLVEAAAEFGLGPEVALPTDARPNEMRPSIQPT